MKKVEKNVMCVLLQGLLDKDLITVNVYEYARNQILATFDGRGFFCAAEDGRKEESHGSTKNPC